MIHFSACQNQVKPTSRIPTGENFRGTCRHRLKGIVCICPRERIINNWRPMPIIYSITCIINNLFMRTWLFDLNITCVFKLNHFLSQRPLGIESRVINNYKNKSCPLWLANLNTSIRRAVSSSIYLFYFSLFVDLQLAFERSYQLLSRKSIQSRGFFHLFFYLLFPQLSWVGQTRNLFYRKRGGRCRCSARVVASKYFVWHFR